MSAPPTADQVPNEQIDSELVVLGYNPNDTCSEHSHEDLRVAWREGYERGVITTVAAARADHRRLIAGE